jgi:hypothetical protein
VYESRLRPTALVATRVVACSNRQLELQMMSILRDLGRRLALRSAGSAAARTRQPAGIRTRIFLAFAVVAGTTVIAGIAASTLFVQIGGQLREVAERNIPEVIATLELASNSEALRAIGPSLLSADTPEEREA